MKKVISPIKSIFFHLLLISISGETVFAQTAFVSPVIATQTGATATYSSLVVTPESVNGSCTEVGQTWTNTFAGTADRRLNGFTIAATSYYVNNFGSLTTVMKRNNSSGGVPATPTCPVTTPPWNDRQIVFFEGTRDFTANTAQIVNSFPSLTLPGTAGYNAVNDMDIVFSRGFINSGADNIFNNLEGSQAGYNSNSNNIERMDLFVSGGVTVTAANRTRVGIVIVCRGPADDPFVVSAIKGLTGGTNIGGGTNYVYDDIIKVNATWTSKTINGGGSIGIVAAQRTTLLTGITSVVLRRMDTDATLNDQLPVSEYPTISSYVAAQNIVGMFFTFADLGLAAGDVFYGYSVAANDVSAITSPQFNSYTNSTYFPLTTNPANGGVDLTGFPGLFSAIDIDDDDDGIPDYVEANLPLAFGDHDTDGVPNWSDANYPGFVDNNADGVNDNFDPSADSDNDGIPNYRDSGFSGYVDSNADGVNDNFDWDLDGISNHLDLDSDNDGIPDVVESGGVDENGDGKIDNYTDTDVDGLSDNVDGNLTGVTGSGNGLGTPDLDSDGIPNYFDLDSDNDGIPDVVEVYGTDTNNNGKLDGYTDTDSDGFSDNADGDVGNDAITENSANASLRTGADGNSDGRADSYPYKNIDNDSKANPYDLDSDGDGITDVKEAGSADTDWDGRIDGAFNANGWSTTIAALPAMNMPDTDATGRVNVYDIDTDDDGIPDNIEGQTTTGYLLPSGADADLDGIDNTYDNFSGFGGDGIHVFDKDGDSTPDYIDTDTDNDGVSDIIEGNDFNLNGLQDDNVTLTGVDTDGDGLDDRFDNNNNTAEGTSQYMGNGGSTSGDPSPGSITTVQQTASGAGCGTERDWRCLGYILKCEFIIFKGALQNRLVQLNWTTLCRQEVVHFIVQRSTDRVSFKGIGVVAGRPVLNEIDSYDATDDISNLSSDIIYYRLKAVMQNGETSISNIIAVRRGNRKETVVQIFPNPVNDQLQISVNAATSLTAQIYILDGNGRPLKKYTENVLPGSNTFTYSETRSLPKGVYYLRLNLGEQLITQKFSVLK